MPAEAAVSASLQASGCRGLRPPAPASRERSPDVLRPWWFLLTQRRVNSLGRPLHCPAGLARVLRPLVFLLCCLLAFRLVRLAMAVRHPAPLFLWFQEQLPLASNTFSTCLASLPSKGLQVRESHSPTGLCQRWSVPPPAPVPAVGAVERGARQVHVQYNAGGGDCLTLIETNHIRHVRKPTALSERYSGVSSSSSDTEKRSTASAVRRKTPLCPLTAA